MSRARCNSWERRRPRRRVSGQRWFRSLSLLALAFLLLRLPLRAATPNFYCARTWQTEDGLPQNAVTAIVQTRDGYLWVGTYSGLARFDGVRFEVFDSVNTPEMHSIRVTSLYQDPEGTLWIGHETGALTRFRNGRFKAVPSAPNWQQRKILDLSSDEAGDLWTLGEDGLLQRCRDGLRLTPEAGTEPGIVSLARDKRGKVWVLRDGKVSALQNGVLAPAKFAPDFPETTVQGICPAGDGGLWVATAAHIRKWRENQWTDDFGPSPWGTGGAFAFVQTRSGALAAGSVSEGLNLVLPGGGAVVFSRTNGFSSDWVRALCEDREGDLWVGTGNGGLAMFRAGNITAVNPPDQWQGRAVLSVCNAHAGGLWIGTEGAGVYRLRDGQWSRFAESEGIHNPFVWSVAEDAAQRLWVGMWGSGLRVQRGERFEPVPGLEEVTAPKTALWHARDGSVWIGTGIGLLHYREAPLTWYGAKEGLELPDVRAVIEDPDGVVWFGMLGGGLGRLKNGELRQFRKRDGLSSDFVQCLRAEADGTLWIGTFGGGLNRLKHERFSAVTVAQGLANNFICHLEEDERGNFWMSSHGGVLCVSKNELQKCADGALPAVRCLAYGKGDGLPTTECSGGLQPAGCRTPDGRLWFTTSKGLVVVDPSQPVVNRLPPPVVIEDLRVDGKSIVPRGALFADASTGGSGQPPPALRHEPFLQIPPGRNRLEFRYTGLSFVSPDKVRFKYQLAGLENEWVDAGTKRSANYSYVPPGDYSFHVRACNNDDVWDEAGAVVSITVLPHFWQTFWFRGLAGAMVVVAASGVVWFDTRRRMRGKLERLERQRAIERERTRIANDIHDDLGASLTRIMLLSQPAQESPLQPGQATTKLDRIYHTARELTRAMAEIVWAVNPRHDTLDSLANFLGKFAQDFLGAAAIRCRLQLPLEPPSWPITAEVRHNLFLAFKESLNNILKHAQATEVQVSLEVQAAGFVLAVGDNGRGFQLAPAADAAVPAGHGNGLRNMRERLRELGGECQIDSAPGAGTKVLFRVPVRVSIA